jgi:hypothetical protein
MCKPLPMPRWMFQIAVANTASAAVDARQSTSRLARAPDAELDDALIARPHECRSGLLASCCPYTTIIMSESLWCIGNMQTSDTCHRKPILTSPRQFYIYNNTAFTVKQRREAVPYRKANRITKEQWRSIIRFWSQTST